MKVYVAIYEHRHGTDVNVFDSEAKALAWRAEIARDCWKEFLDEPMPEDEEEVCRVYWEVAGECMNHAEYFNIEEKEVL